MGLEYVDIFYSHRPDPNTPLEETMGALHDAVRAGKALYVGISSYPPEQTRHAVQILASLGTRCLIHQPKYSMLVRDPERGLLDAIRDTGLGCIVFSPLAQGLLTDRYLKGVPTGRARPRRTAFSSRTRWTDATGHGPPPERRRAGARANPRADGAGLDAAPCESRPPSSGRVARRMSRMRWGRCRSSSSGRRS